MNTNGQKGIGRRDFLKSASCALATAAVAPQLFAGSTSKPKAIVAGFAPLAADTAAAEFAFNVDAADRLRSPDGTFLRTDARIRVAGVSGGELKTRRSREFVTHFSVADGAGKSVKVPFTSWRCGRVVECNTPVSFNIPVSDDQKIQFSVYGEGASSSEETAMPVELTLRSDGQGLALNRGYYIIVPLFDAQSTPEWSLYSLRRNAAGRLALHEIAGGEIRPVAFEHFVIRVDYARPGR